MSFQLPLLQTPLPATRSMLNMTYQTLAISWINHGFTDVQKCEYEIVVRIVPQTPRMMMSSNDYLEESATDKGIVKQKLIGAFKLAESALEEVSSPE
jgi:hypothetical protein